MNKNHTQNIWTCVVLVIVGTILIPALVSVALKPDPMSAKVLVKSHPQLQQICELAGGCDKIKIEFGNSVINISRGTDTDLFVNRERYTVLYDGRVKGKIINDYGENDFLVTYDNKYYLSFRQFKFNANHQHDYYFRFFQNNSKELPLRKIQ